MYFNLAPQIGGKSQGDRLDQVTASPNFQDGKFQNPIPTSMDMPMGAMASVMWEFMIGESNREPISTIEVIRFEPETFARLPKEEIAISWFGHSSLLIRIDGKVLLTDPVFSPRASMFSFMGPKRFKYTQYMTVDDLPQVDAVILSHDHYDHLDYETISELKDRVNKFYAPLGVGAHLEEWGVQAGAITELDWWDSTDHEGLGLTLTPARHFSGRGFSRFETLWGSWVIAGKDQKVFFNGDSGYFPGFKEIGEKYGPFDITLMECGAYNAHLLRRKS